MNKSVHAVFRPAEQHWVGDGFPVRTLFSYNRYGRSISPFLLLDHAGPMEFTPSQEKRGVGAHPHRGFETVTIVYDGEVSHRDTSGAGGTIGQDEVQWMTAASGLMHEEFHSDDFTQRGGKLEMVQLWVNLPAQHKMDAPRYQSLTRERIPQVMLPDGAGRLRVIAGNFEGVTGAAQTHTPINLWDVRLHGAHEAQLQLPQGHTLLVMVVRGSVTVNGEQAHAGEWLQLGREGSGLLLQAQVDASVLVLGGEPIDEPIAGQGPFVMNTHEELNQAFGDFYAGRFGQIPATVS